MDKKVEELLNEYNKQIKNDEEENIEEAHCCGRRNSTCTKICCLACCTSMCDAICNNH